MTTAKTKPVTKPCIDGTLAHRWNLGDADASTGGITPAFCTRCQGERTYNSRAVEIEQGNHRSFRSSAKPTDEEIEG